MSHGIRAAQTEAKGQGYADGGARAGPDRAAWVGGAAPMIRGGHATSGLSDAVSCQTLTVQTLALVPSVDVPSGSCRWPPSTSAAAFPAGPLTAPATAAPLPTRDPVVPAPAPTAGADTAAGVSAAAMTSDSAATRRCHRRAKLCRALSMRLRSVWPLHKATTELGQASPRQTPPLCGAA